MNNVCVEEGGGRSGCGIRKQHFLYAINPPKSIHVVCHPWHTPPVLCSNFSVDNTITFILPIACVKMYSKSYTVHTTTVHHWLFTVGCYTTQWHSSCPQYPRTDEDFYRQRETRLGGGLGHLRPDLCLHKPHPPPRGTGTLAGRYATAYPTASPSNNFWD